MHKPRSAPIILFSALARSMRGAAQEHFAEHNWGYARALGASQLGGLKPQFATSKTGHHQSPIEIRNPQQAALPAIHFHYEPTPLDIIGNGHTTTPPCTENVTWFVLNDPATVSGAEINGFSQLYGDDARPTQPLYDRIVLESQ